MRKQCVSIFLIALLVLVGRAQAIELQGFKGLKFGMSLEEVCSYRYINSKTCHEWNAAIDGVSIAWNADGLENLRDLTVFGYAAESLRLSGSPRTGLTSVSLFLTAPEKELSEAISGSFGAAESWIAPSAPWEAYSPKETVYFWKASNGASIAMTRPVKEQLFLKDYSNVEFMAASKTKSFEESHVQYRTKASSKPDATDF